MEQIIVRKKNQVSFLSDIGGSATSLDLKSNIIIYNFTKMQLNLIRSFSYGDNIVSYTYIKTKLSSRYLFSIIT